jgi:hypothetical protein
MFFVLAAHGYFLHADIYILVETIMNTVLAILLVLVLVLVYSTSCSTGPIAEKIKLLKAKITGKSEGMTVAESTRVVNKLGSIFDREDTLRDGSAYTSGNQGGAYDPINMGALKQTEIDAHKRGLSEMTPFNSYGPSGPNKTLRDDDEYTRNTGPKYFGKRYLSSTYHQRIGTILGMKASRSMGMKASLPHFLIYIF